MIYHVRHPAPPAGGGLGWVSHRPLMKFRGPGPLGLRVPLHLLPLRTHGGDRSGHLINASPMSYPLARETSAASPGARTGFVRNV